MTRTEYVYKPVIAENYFCFAAVLEMILSLYCDNIDQQKIAEYFGVAIPSDHNVRISNYVQTDNSTDWGMSIKGYGLNEFFRKLKLSCEEEYIPISTINELVFHDFIQEHILLNRHIVCGYNYNMLHQGDSKKQIGHVSIILAVDSNHVDIYDPGPKNHGAKTVKIDELYRAIRNYQSGLWIIRNA